MPAPELQDLIDRDAVLQVVHRYVDRVDALDVDGVQALFLPDAGVELFGLSREGSETIARHLGRALGHFEATSHHVTNPLVAVRGDDADVSAGLYAWHRRPDSRWWHVWGRYDFGLHRTSAGWRVAHLRLVGIGGGPDTDPSERSLYTGHPGRAASGNVGHATRLSPSPEDA